MNREKLNRICKNYIEKFELINNKENDENYKWEIAQIFQSFDVDSTNFREEISRICKASENLIDSAQQLPFAALVKYSELEPETVREMFRNLFSDKDCDIDAKQEKIAAFIDQSESLRKKYFPNSHLYINNQRSVMQYLFLRYPEENYGYKASQAKEFANYIEFYDDWGPMSDFDLKIYSRMCEQIIAELRENNALIKTHNSRFEDTVRSFHPDKNLHILLFDLIFSARFYELYDGVEYSPMTAQERNLRNDRVMKAEKFNRAFEKAQKDSRLLEEANSYIKSLSGVGCRIVHKQHGIGVVQLVQPYSCVVDFADKKGVKIVLNQAILMGFVRLEDENFDKKLEQFRDVLTREFQIPKTLARCEQDLKPYQEYLDE